MKQPKPPTPFWGRFTTWFMIGIPFWTIVMFFVVKGTY
jgi:hypothetical protein